MKNTYIPIEVNKQNKVKTWYLDVTNLGLEELISLKNELNLETNMFAAYPQSNIPFSYSNSWIGM